MVAKQSRMWRTSATWEPESAQKEVLKKTYTRAIGEGSSSLSQAEQKLEFAGILHNNQGETFQLAGKGSPITWIKCKKTYQFTTPCKSDDVTHPKQHKSFFLG